MHNKASLSLCGIFTAIMIFAGTTAGTTSNMIFANPPTMMMDHSGDKHMGKMMMAMKMSPMMCMDARDAMQMMMSKKMMEKPMMMGDNMSMMMGDNMSMMMEKPMMMGDNMSMMMDKPMMMCMDIHDAMMMQMMKQMKSGGNASGMMMMGNNSMM